MSQFDQEERSGHESRKNLQRQKGINSLEVGCSSLSNGETGSVETDTRGGFSELYENQQEPEAVEKTQEMNNESKQEKPYKSILEPRSGVLWKMKRASRILEKGSKYKKFAVAQKEGRPSLANDLSPDQWNELRQEFEDWSLRKSNDSTNFGSLMATLSEREYSDQISEILEPDILRYASFRSQGMSRKEIDLYMPLPRESEEYEEILEENDWYENNSMVARINQIYRFASKEGHDMDFSF